MYSTHMQAQASTNAGWPTHTKKDVVQPTATREFMLGFPLDSALKPSTSSLKACREQQAAHGAHLRTRTYTIAYQHTCARAHIRAHEHTHTCTAEEEVWRRCGMWTQQTEVVCFLRIKSSSLEHPIQSHAQASRPRLGPPAVQMCRPGTDSRDGLN